MKKTKLTRSLLAAVSVVALSAVVYGCSSGVSDADHRAAIEAEKKAAAEAAAAAAEKAKMEAEEAARKAEMERLAQIEAARQAIAAAETAAAAQAAKDAVNDVATAAEAAGLQAEVAARIMALETMASADAQKMALMDAAGNVDTSGLSDADAIAAANTAIAALKAALAAATDVSDADKTMYQSQVDAAETAVMTAQSALDHAAQTMALSTAVTALQAIDLSGLSTQEAIDETEAAIASLKMALDAATELSDAEKAVAMTVLATANRVVMAAQGRVDTASQMTMVSEAAAALDAIDLDDLMTQEQIDAANAAIVALDLALAAATNLTDAQKLDATVDVTVAKRRVAAAEVVLAENVDTQRMALTEAGTALGEIDLDDLSDQAKIDAAKRAVAALKTALDGATHLSAAAKAMYQSQLDTATETVRTAQTGMDSDERMMTQRTAITDAVTAARTAVGMVDNDATEAEVMAADSAVAALKAAIDGAEDLPEGDAGVIGAQATLTTLEGQLKSAKTSRTAALEKKAEDDRKAKAEEDRKKNEAMAATAAKLYAGISAQMGDGDLTNLEANDRDAAYNTAGTAIEVSIGGAAAADAAITLSEDKKTMVAANYGWEGKRYTAEPDDDGMYEAIVYSNVEAPTMGKKFGGAAAGDEFQYTLADGLLTATNASEGGAFVAENVALTGVTRTAGTETFELPEGDLSGSTAVTGIPGSYHGVSGTYNCTFGAATCAARVAAKGFELGTQAEDGTFTAGGWTFKPSNPNARVMDMADEHYASYGWWIHKAANDGPFIASAFVDEKGTVDAASGLNTLNGTATYRGGAAGKYALSSSTGGTNDAGHFTARATLEADFTNNTEETAITGTIDMFMGADGESRDWEVELKGSQIDDTGEIGDASATTTDVKTVWTIGGTAADAAGNWTGSLRNNGDDGVPQVATGTFYSMYGTAGKMVGAFGANKQ